MAVLKVIITAATRRRRGHQLMETVEKAILMDQRGDSATAVRHTVHPTTLAVRRLV